MDIFLQIFLWNFRSGLCGYQPSVIHIMVSHLQLKSQCTPQNIQNLPGSPHTKYLFKEILLT